MNYQNNLITIKDNGVIAFNGTATVWEDENLDPLMLTGAGNLPTSIQFATTGLHVAGFSGIPTDEVEAVREVPHKSKLNQSGKTSVVIIFHAHTYATNNTVANVRLGLEYLFTKEGVAVTTSNTIYTTFTTSGIAWAKKTVSFADIPVPEELGSQFKFRFFRLGADPLDTYNDTIGIDTIGFHYEIDQNGSDTPTTK